MTVSLILTRASVWVLKDVDVVARFPSNIIDFSVKISAYQELFCVVTLIASSAQPQSRPKQENKTAAGLKL